MDDQRCEYVGETLTPAQSIRKPEPSFDSLEFAASATSAAGVASSKPDTPSRLVEGSVLQG